MHSASSYYQSNQAQHAHPIKKKKSVKADMAAVAEVKVAPYCVNKAGEITPKTDLNRLLAASCDCV